MSTSLQVRQNFLPTRQGFPYVFHYLKYTNFPPSEKFPARSLPVCPIFPHLLANQACGVVKKTRVMYQSIFSFSFIVGTWRISTSLSDLKSFFDKNSLRYGQFSDDSTIKCHIFKLIFRTNISSCLIPSYILTRTYNLISPPTDQPTTYYNGCNLP